MLLNQHMKHLSKTPQPVFLAVGSKAPTQVQSGM